MEDRNLGSSITDFFKLSPIQTHGVSKALQLYEGFVPLKGCFILPQIFVHSHVEIILLQIPKANMVLMERKGTKKSVIQWAKYFCDIFFIHISFNVKSKPSKFGSLIAYEILLIH